MRAEDKQLEGPELERSLQSEREQIESQEREHEELPLAGGEQIHDVELQHRSRLFDALRLIVAGEQLTVSLLGLPQREALALEALQTAVNGRDVHGDQFVFAEDRKTLLEQALAVLQQNLTYGDAAELAELHGRYDELVERIGEIREQLTNLEDAQDDLFDEKRQYLEEVADDEQDDDADKPADTTSEPADEVIHEARPSTLGEPAVRERKPTSPLRALLRSVKQSGQLAGYQSSLTAERKGSPKAAGLFDGIERRVSPNDPKLSPVTPGRRESDRRSTLYGDDDAPAPPTDEPPPKPPLKRGKRG